MTKGKIIIIIIIHWKICREYGMDGLHKEWYDHIPTPVTTVAPPAQFYTINKSTQTELCQPTNRISSCDIIQCRRKKTPDSQRSRQKADAGNKDRNYSGHRGGSTGSLLATINKRKFKKDFE